MICGKNTDSELGSKPQLFSNTTEPKLTLPRSLPSSCPPSRLSQLHFRTSAYHTDKRRQTKSSQSETRGAEVEENPNLVFCDLLLFSHHSSRPPSHSSPPSTLLRPTPKPNHCRLPVKTLAVAPGSTNELGAASEPNHSTEPPCAVPTSPRSHQ